jgi:hypothetical protein
VADKSWQPKNVLMVTLGIVLSMVGYRVHVDTSSEGPVATDTTAPVTAEEIATMVDEVAPREAVASPSAAADRPAPERALGGAYPTEERPVPPDDLVDSSAPAGPTDPGSELGTGVLRLVYFVESDQEADPEAVALIERQAAGLQQFWYDQFGGTFYLPASGVDIVYGEHPAQWYDEEPNGDDARWYRLMNVRAEVRASLGILPGDDVRILTYPSARIDGRVGANRYGGAWMDGDDLACITGQVETIPYSLDYPASCLATVAHELGHVYGLGHLGEEEDCMQFGFYQYVSGDQLCSFSAENRSLVTADPHNQGWLDAEPGERR